MVHALGVEPETFWRIDAEPLCVAEVAYEGGRWPIRKLNGSLLG
jgi:hypothetical protein